MQKFKWTNDTSAEDIPCSAASAERGKKQRASKCQLWELQILIGWEGGATFLSQSQNNYENLSL